MRPICPTRPPRAPFRCSVKTCASCFCSRPSRARWPLVWTRATAWAASWQWWTNRQGAGHRGGLPGAGVCRKSGAGQGKVKGPDPPPRCGDHRHRQRHCRPGDRASCRRGHQELGGGVSYMVVSEAGASVYSASKLAAEEFPEYDVNLRSAVSIARRLQDPLAELVKIDPKSHRRGPVSARYAPGAAERNALRRGGGLRQRRGGGSEHRSAPRCWPVWRA